MFETKIVRFDALILYQNTDVPFIYQYRVSRHMLEAKNYTSSQEKNYYNNYNS